MAGKHGSLSVVAASICSRRCNGAAVAKCNTNWGRPLFFAWAFFGLALVPVLGFADVGFLQFSPVADHYQHIALIAVVALWAAGIVRWRSRSSEPTQLAFVALPVAVVLLLAALVWQRASLFGDPINFYTATLQSNPQNWQLRVSLSAALNHAGRYEDAVEQCREVLRSNPNNADSHFNLAVALGKTGRIAEGASAVPACPRITARPCRRGPIGYRKYSDRRRSFRRSDRPLPAGVAIQLKLCRGSQKPRHRTAGQRPNQCGHRARSESSGNSTRQCRCA